MPATHKAAPQQAQKESRILRRYLNAIAMTREGRPSAASIRQRINASDRRLASPARFSRLSLLVKRRELQHQLRCCKETADMAT